MSKLKLVTTLVFASLALALLGGLSLWQLLRWQEKENQAALLASRNLVPALSLEAALQKQAKGDNLKGEIINLDGMFQNSATLYKLASHKGGPAWELITPLITKSGKIVLVDRGLIPQEGRIFFETMQEKTDVKIRAIVMTLRGQQGIFDPENDPEANIWYWWDLAAMKAALKLENEQELAPFIVQELSPPSTMSSKASKATPTEIIERQNPVPKNNHLSYAVTWFSLALALVGVVTMYLRSQRKSTK